MASIVNLDSHTQLTRKASGIEDILNTSHLCVSLHVSSSGMTHLLFKWDDTTLQVG